MTEKIIITEVDATGLTAAEMKSRYTLTLIIYALQGLSFVVGITGLAAIIMNYVKRDEMTGTWLESHFLWQIRTFWYGLLWAVVGVALMWIVVGSFIIFANAVWVIYRIVRGILNLLDNKPMYQ